jgi:hypothetical protein
LAAVIAAFVFGMAGQITKTKTVAVTVQRINGTAATFTNMGGQDATGLAATTPIIISGAGMGSLGKAVGSTTTVTVGAAPAHIVATGEFTDGTFQVLLDTSI